MAYEIVGFELLAETQQRWGGAALVPQSVPNRSTDVVIQSTADNDESQEGQLAGDAHR